MVVAESDVMSVYLAESHLSTAMYAVTIVVVNRVIKYTDCCDRSVLVGLAG